MRAVSSAGHFGDQPNAARSRKSWTRNHDSSHVKLLGSSNGLEQIAPDAEGFDVAELVSQAGEFAAL